MAAKSRKPKSKGPSVAKTKKPNNKPLLAASVTMLKTKPVALRKRARTATLSPAALNPTLVIIDLMGRVMTAYAELPIRLAQCRSPMDLWLEQARFAQRVFAHSNR
jgi:hypothetical protein